MSDLRYRVVIQFDQDKERFVARAPELPQCSAEGTSYEEALQLVESEIEAQLHNMKEQGQQAPPPLDEVDVSGELSFKVSKSLHRELRLLVAAGLSPPEALERFNARGTAVADGSPTPNRTRCPSNQSWISRCVSRDCGSFCRSIRHGRRGIDANRRG